MVVGICWGCTSRVHRLSLTYVVDGCCPGSRLFTFFVLFANFSASNCSSLTSAWRKSSVFCGFVTSMYIFVSIESPLMRCLTRVASSMLGLTLEHSRSILWKYDMPSSVGCCCRLYNFWPKVNWSIPETSIKWAVIFLLKVCQSWMVFSYVSFHSLAVPLSRSRATDNRCSPSSWTSSHLLSNSVSQSSTSSSGRPVNGVISSSFVMRFPCSCLVAWDTGPVSCCTCCCWLVVATGRSFDIGSGCDALAPCRFPTAVVKLLMVNCWSSISFLSFLFSSKSISCLSITCCSSNMILFCCWMPSWCCSTWYWAWGFECCCFSLLMVSSLIVSLFPTSRLIIDFVSATSFFITPNSDEDA